MRELPEEALLPDSDVLEESAGLRMEVDDAQVQARQSHTAVPAELSTGSGPQASSACKREIESSELGDIGAFDMDVKEENPEVRVQSIADHRWQMGKSVDANGNHGCDASQRRSPRTSRWRTTGPTACTRKSREGT